MTIILTEFNLVEVVTMTMEVLHNICNMYTLDLTDMYAQARGQVDKYQSNHLCSYYSYITCILTGMHTL